MQIGEIYRGKQLIEERDFGNPDKVVWVTVYTKSKVIGKIECYGNRCLMEKAGRYVYFDRKNLEEKMRELARFGYEYGINVLKAIEDEIEMEIVFNK